MVKIGIIGDSKEFHTARTVLHLYQSKGLRVYWKHISQKSQATPLKWFSEASRKKADILLIILEETQLAEKVWEKLQFHILVYLNGKKNAEQRPKKMSRILEEKNVIIINSDNRELFPFSISAGSTLITCGINSKASITASSVICDGNYETVQCCIQRAIRTISGEKLEPQEFSVSVKDENQSVTGVLAAVAAAMADDIEVSELNLSIL